MLGPSTRGFGDLTRNGQDLDHVVPNRIFTRKLKNKKRAIKINLYKNELSINFSVAAQKNQKIRKPNVSTNNIFELISQYWAETTYPQESRYDLGNRNIPQNWWTILYRDVIEDLQRSIDLMSQEQTDPTLLPEDQVAYKNKLAIAKILKAYAYSVLVNTFGDIPYTEALQGDANTTPVYDDAQTVYYSLLDSIDAGINELDVTGGSFGDADLIYGGDVSAWYKFSNSIKLKLGMIIADSDPAKAKSEVESAVAAGVFESNADNALFQYLSTPPNVNPIWTNLIQSGRNDFVPANTLVDKMNDLDDPRRPFYFSLDPNDGYSGGIYGNGNTFANFSHVSDKISAPDFPSIIMDYAEVEFLLAEAVERGMSVEGTAAEHYNTAVTASITYWGGSQAEADTYLAQPSVNYATASTDWKEKIGVQAWIAYYPRGFDAWIEWRRLDFPELPKPISAITDIPLRYTYPSNEQTLNEANYDAASAAIGGDAVTTKLFWDIY